MQRLTLQVHDGDGVEVLEALQKGSLQLHRSAHDGCSKHVGALQVLQEDGNKLLRMDWGKKNFLREQIKPQIQVCFLVCLFVVVLGGYICNIITSFVSSVCFPV